MSLKATYKGLHPALRWMIAVIAGLIIILLILQLLIAVFADDYLANRLKSTVHQSSPYTLKFEDLDLNLFAGSVELNEAHLSTDSAATIRNKLNIKVEGIEAEGISFWSYFFDDKLTIDEILINNPAITAAVPNNSEQGQRQNNQILTSLDSLLYSAIAPRFQALTIGRFEVEDATITALKSKNRDTLASIENLHLTLQNIHIDSTAVESKNYFITDDFSLKIKNGSYRLSNLYQLKVDELKILSSRQTLKIDSLQLIPQYPKFKFGQVHGYEIDRIDLLIPTIKMEKIAFDKLVKTGRLEAEKLVINNANMVDFRNKALPFPPNQSPPLPHIALRNMDFTLKIDTIKVNDAFISYNEYHEGAPQAGTVTFEHLNGTITNVTNYPGLIEQGIIMKMDASAQVMGKALLETHFEFPMNTDIGFHRIEGSIDNLPLPALNPIFKYVAFAKINDGQINHLEFAMNLNQKESQGELIMNYENLEISLLDKETMEQTGILTDIKTVLANAVIVEGNTPDEGMRLGKIAFERIQKKSFFNYWWKSLYSGMKDLILD